MRSSGAGGQHVNKTESAIRITHLPTGIVVAVQEERSQHRNRAKAMALLRARILDARTSTQADASAPRSGAPQVGSGDRSQRIRTYNFPQGRVTDHRINLTLYSLDRIMEGEGLDAMIDALAAERQARLLAEQARAMTVRLPPFAPGQTIGLLGGSFNPPHEGHRLISELALAPPRLDRVWWLVTPGNPLKSPASSPTRARVAAARRDGARSAHRGDRLRGGDRLALHLPDDRSGSAAAPRASASSGSWGPTIFASSIAGGAGARSPIWRRSSSSTGRARRLGALAGRAGAGARAATAARRRWRRRFARLPPPAFLFLHGPRSDLSSTALGAARALRTPS